MYLLVYTLHNAHITLNIQLTNNNIQDNLTDEYIS